MQNQRQDFNIENPNGKESIMMMGEYKIDLRVICCKKISISEYKLLKTFSHKNKNSKIGQIMKALKRLKRPHKTLVLAPN